MSSDATTEQSEGKGRLTYGSGCRVLWQDDDGQWYRGTVASHGDRGHEIDVETKCYVGKDIRTFPPERVSYGWEE